MNDDQNSAPPTGWQFRPGETVAPATDAPAPNPTEAPQAPPQIAQAPASPQVQTSPAQPAAAAPAPAASTEAPADDTSTLPPTADMDADQDDEVVAWTASEYVAHQKNAGWFLLLGLATLALVALIYLLTKDKISAALILVIAATFGVSAGHKPRVLDYRLDRRGLTIARKFYGYAQFRSFAVVEEGAFSSIVFMPLKRFMPMLTIYFAPEDEDRIVQMLADRLPLEAHKRDAVERLMHKIRF